LVKTFAAISAFAGDMLLWCDVVLVTHPHKEKMTCVII